MRLPIGPDYNDAIQNPKMNLRDPCLRRGTIATNQLGLPRVNSGNFASVFELIEGSQRWAVKCFTRHTPDQQERYKAISDYLKAHPLSFIVAFDYQQDGILVQGAWYPLLRMQWVDGLLLDAYVRTHLKDKSALQQLATKWLLLIESLRKAGVAHGDLQFGNVKIVGGDIRLIDYDGMYVPALKQKGSNETGHPNFQHPRRSGKDFDQYIDNFSAWVIYTSLIALMEYPAIWAEANGGNDCLIFRKSDFDSPASSPVFEKLERVGSKELRSLLARIRNYTHLAPQQVPPLDINTRAPTSTPGPQGMNPPRFATGGGLPDWIPTPSVTAEDSRTTNHAGTLLESKRGTEIDNALMLAFFTFVGVLTCSDLAVPLPITLAFIAAMSTGALLLVCRQYYAFGNRLQQAEWGVRNHATQYLSTSRHWDYKVASIRSALEAAVQDAARKANDALVLKQTEIRDKTNTIDQQLNMIGMMGMMGTRFDARLTHRLHEVRTAFIDERLRGRELRDVHFEGLGATMQARLVEAGFCNAFDVLANNPRNVSGIGTERAYALETWAREIRVEAEASAPQHLPKKLVDEMLAEHALHKQRLEEQKDDLQRELGNVTQSVHRSLAEEQTQLRSRFRLDEERLAREWQEAARKRARELGESSARLRADGVRIAAELEAERERLMQAKSVLTAQRQEEVRKHEDLKTITFGKFLYAAKSLSYEKVIGSVLCVVPLLCMVFVFKIEPLPLSPTRDPSADSDESVQVHDSRDVIQASPDELPAEVRVGDEELRERLLGKAAADKAAALAKKATAAARALTQNLGMEFVNINTRRFSMGSPASEVHRDSDETQVTVSILNDFELGTTEVTQGQFKKVMGTEPWLNQDSVQIGEDNAATYVDWNDATAFCQKLTDLERKADKLQTGKAYRLPTEAEWEYACRAGTTKAFSFGNDEKQLGNYGWFDGNAKNVGQGYAHKVGMKKPNPAGLFDMHGNVWEWCSDWYDEKLLGGTDPVGPGGGSDRVIRGGCWRGSPDLCRSAFRGNLVPSHRFYNLGFRVARSQSETVAERRQQGAQAKPAPQVAAAERPIQLEAHSIGMKLVELPAGKFTMGAVTVTLTKTFLLGTTEVTQGQFKEVMGTEPWLNQDSVQIGEGNAATYVDWNDATAFCQKLTNLERKTGRLKDAEEYRLPTEAEWEYACRAGTTTAFSFGNDKKQLGQYAWFRANAFDAGEQYAHKVGLKKPNSWGLYDMHGNVWEWCSDYWYGKKLSGGTDPVGPGEGSARVIRGGGWGFVSGLSQSAYRDGNVPSSRYNTLGFRVARSQKSP